MWDIFVEYLKELSKGFYDYIKHIIKYSLPTKNKKKKSTEHNETNKYTPGHKGAMPTIPKEAMELCNKMQAAGRPVTPKNKNAD